jgi:hypothetical protein
VWSDRIHCDRARAAVLARPWWAEAYLGYSSEEVNTPSAVSARNSYLPLVSGAFRPAPRTPYASGRTWAGPCWSANFCLFFSFSVFLLFSLFLFSFSIFFFRFFFFIQNLYFCSNSNIVHILNFIQILKNVHISIFV